MVFTFQTNTRQTGFKPILQIIHILTDKPLPSGQLMFAAGGKSDTTATLSTDQNSACQKIYKQNVFVCTLLTTTKIANFVITDHNDMEKELKEKT